MRRALLGAVLALALVAPAARASAGAGSTSIAPPEFAQFPLPADSTRAGDAEMVRRRVELLVRSGRLDEAITMIEERRASQGLDRALERRLARLYRDAERWADLDALITESIKSDGSAQNADVGQLRLLAEARYELGRAEEGRKVLDEILARDPQDPSLARLVASALSQRGRTAEALEVLEQARKRLGLPLEFAQLMGSLYAQSGDVVAATREYCRVIVASPLNVSLMRGQVLELAETAPERIGAMQKAAEELATAHPEVTQLKIIVAELQLRRGDDQRAWRTLAPLLNDPELEQELLRLALAGLADSRLPGNDPVNTLHRLRLSARISRGLLANETLPTALEARVTDTLVRSLLAMLENDAFAGQPEAEQLEVLDETRRSILDMQDRFAGNELTGAALLRLAGAYVDGLHRPASAIEIYERLAVSPNSSREHAKLARLGLGRSYVAAGDTARAREVFHHVGQDMEFPQGQGRAQFHLGMIDFMGGAFTTAADRFKAVAMEQPLADYTNDALDLALVLAEFEMSGVEDDAPLRAYGRALYLRAVHEPEQLVSTLETIAESAASPIRDRARLDLARLAREGGRNEVALGWARRISAEDGASRYAAAALDLEGEVLEGLGRVDEALAVYERLLLEHEGYVMIDRIRDRVRDLRDGPQPEEGEIP